MGANAPRCCSPLPPCARASPFPVTRRDTPKRRTERGQQRAGQRQEGRDDVAIQQEQQRQAEDVRLARSGHGLCALVVSSD